MILLNKKRILFINLSILFSIFTYSILNNFQSLPTSSTPISNHVIIIDAGHGRPDGGAIGISGSIESDLNLQIALKLQHLLESLNCTVILTRSDENSIYDLATTSIKKKKISDMKKRAYIANNSNAEAFISIHMNTLNDSSCTGWQTFYKKDDEKSLILGKLIQENLSKYISNTNTKQAKPISNIYLSKNVCIPFVLVECGFISNSDEEKLLLSDSYQEKLAWGIFCGISDYMNLNN